MKAGHFSAKIPGQLSAEINSLCSQGREVPTIRLIPGESSWLVLTVTR